jgi:hypothetical protein
MRKGIQGFVIGVIVTVLLLSATAFAAVRTQTIEVVLNSINVSINGKIVGPEGKGYTLENGTVVPYSILYKGTTYLPMRKVSEFVGKEVSWNASTNTAGINDKGFVDNQAPGWHFVEHKYYKSSQDVTIVGSIESGVIGTADKIYDTYTGEGSKGNFTITHSRKDKNGNAIASYSYKTVWDDPPAYLAPNKKVGFNIDVKTLSSKTWLAAQVSSSFDSADFAGPGGASSSKISFQTSTGETHLRDVKSYYESSKVIPEGRPGNKRAIWMHLGDGYGYAYIYEWRN